MRLRSWGTHDLRLMCESRVCAVILAPPASLQFRDQETLSDDSVSRPCSRSIASNFKCALRPDVKLSQLRQYGVVVVRRQTRCNSGGATFCLRLSPSQPPSAPLDTTDVMPPHSDKRAYRSIILLANHDKGATLITAPGMHQGWGSGDGKAGRRQI